MNNEFENVNPGSEKKNPNKNKALLFAIIGAVAVVAIILLAVILPKLFDKKTEEVNLFHEDLVCFFDGQEWGYANKKGKKVISAKYAEAYAFAENGLALASKDGKTYGYINKKGEFEIKDKYIAGTGFYDNGLAVVMNDKNEVGAIDKNGETVIEFKYASIGQFNEEGLAVVGKYNDKEGRILFGVIDSKGELVFPVKYEDIKLPAKNGSTVAKDDGVWGVLNKKGEWTVKPRYASAEAFDEFNLSIVCNKEGEFGVINTKGDVVIKLGYQAIRPFSEDDGLAFYKEDDKWGVINTKGKVVVDADFDKVFADYADGRAIVEDRDDYIVIDKKGEEIFEFEDCKPCAPYNNGLILVQEIRRDNKVGKFGYMDTKGELVIDFEYYDAESFYPADFACVMDDQYYGFIDKNGKEVIALDYDEGGAFFSDGYAVVFEEDENGDMNCIILNKSGKVVFDKCETVRFDCGYKTVSAGSAITLPDFGNNNNNEVETEAPTSDLEDEAQG